MVCVEDEKEDVLEIGRPLPRWVRLGALMLAVLAALALFAVRVWPGSGTTHPVAVPPATPWPTAPGVCGLASQPAMVSSTPRTERTGIRVLLGGDQLRVVDFDGGDAESLAAAGLGAGEYASVHAGPVGAYATTASCGPGRPGCCASAPTAGSTWWDRSARPRPCCWAAIGSGWCRTPLMPTTG